ncbi:MAG: gliding motility-associated C-terminal domain-containing protein [Bacteroidota bacterium]
MLFPIRWVAVLGAFLLAASTVGWSQNLVPNSSFENTAEFDYQDPQTSLMYLEDWYVLGGGRTPDLFDFNYPWPQNGNLNFWNKALGTPAGVKHVGIANTLSEEGYRQPEALAIELIEPLEAGRAYAVELQVRNKGIAAYNGQTPQTCVLDVDKAVQVLLSDESLALIDDQQEKTTYPVAETILPLTSDPIQSNASTDWHPVGSCLVASGGESHLGLSLSYGQFDVEPPCVIATDSWNAFYIYYSDVDAIVLHPLPEKYELTGDLCIDEATSFNLEELIELPRMQKPIEFLWDDGFQGPSRSFDRAGNWTGVILLDCKSIPFELVVSEIRCQPKYYVPNIFSPNFDGINDVVQAHVDSDIPLQEGQFMIFDRWGNQVFSTDDFSQSWDGTWRGQRAAQGVYTWALRYEWIDLEGQNQRVVQSGDIYLLR